MGVEQLIAAIAEGHVDGADIFFLIAVIVFVIAAGVYWAQSKALAPALACLAAASTAFALLLL